MTNNGSHKKRWFLGIVPVVGIAVLWWSMLDQRSIELHPISSAGQNVHPDLAVDVHGNVYATWIQIKDGSSQVMFSKSEDRGRSFQPPVAVSPPEMDLDTGADGGPEIEVGSQGQIYLAWGGTLSQEPTMRPSGLEVPGKHIHNSRAALDIYFSRSLDGGRTFSAPKPVNDDVNVGEGDSLEKQFRHRLPAMTLGPDEAIYITWIDKRKGDSLDPNITDIFVAKSTDGGETFGPNIEATALQQESTCICCKPSVSVGSANEVMVTFRNSIDEIKDMYTAFSTDGGQSYPAMLPVDHGGWQFFGCPMSGPSTAAHSGELHVVWADGGAHGAAGHDAQIGLTVFYARKGRSDARFSPRLPLSASGNHPTITVTRSGRFFAVWEEYSKEGADIYLAELTPGSAPRRRRISHSDSAYYPVVVPSPDGRELYVAWKDIGGDKPQIHFAAVPIAGNALPSFLGALGTGKWLQ
ncbi:MAG TPA: sialidase family protein [Terriglobia bacterium]|nr:sialidase family protein [Terriglobia bacterium]